jgi:hypothetical protein
MSDWEKVLQLAPNSRDAKMARQTLKKLHLLRQEKKMG